MLNIFYEDSELNNVFWKKLNKEFLGNNCILKPFKKIKEIVPLIYGLPDGIENNNLLIGLEPSYFDLYVEDAVSIKAAAQNKDIRLFLTEIDSVEEAVLSCGYIEILCQNNFDFTGVSEDFAMLSAYLCENENKLKIKTVLLKLAVKLGLCVRSDMSNREISKSIIMAFRDNDNVLSEGEFFSEFIDNLLESMEVFGTDKKWLSFEQCSEFSRVSLSFAQMKEMSSRYKSINSLVKALIADDELFRFKDGFKMEPEVLKLSLENHFKTLYREKISPVLSDGYFDELMDKFKESVILSFARAYFKSREKILFEYGSKIYNHGLSERDVYSIFNEWNTEYVSYILFEKAEKEELEG